MENEDMNNDAFSQEVENIRVMVRRKPQTLEDRLDSQQIIIVQDDVVELAPPKDLDPATYQGLKTPKSS